MRIIPTKMHAIMDYIGGLALIVVPLFWLEDGSPALMVPMVAGVIILLQSLFTDYEISLSNALPMPAHLGMDGLLGAVVLASPWLFGFAESVWIPHVILGILLIGSALMTQLHRGAGPAITRDAGRKHAV